MANNDNHRDLVIEQDTINAGIGEADLLNNVADGIGGGAGPNRFGIVRDRLFHVMLVKIALSYSQHVSYTFRRLIEFFVLIASFSLLCLLIYVHTIFNQLPGTCLNEIRDIWPKRGVLRVEVIQNWDEFPIIHLNKDYEGVPLNCIFDVKRILMEGPSALPEEIKSKQVNRNIKIGFLNGKFIGPNNEIVEDDSENDTNESNLLTKKKALSSDLMLRVLNFMRQLLTIFYSPFEYDTMNYTINELLDAGTIENVSDNNRLNILKEIKDVEELATNDSINDAENLEDETFDENAAFVYVIEYSLHYGLLKLSPIMRQQFGVPVMLVQLDAESDKCFGDWKNRFLMKYLVGFEDIIMSSVRALAENETEKGFLHDMISGEHYHFVSVGVSRTCYLTALLVMLIFTFAISMLLRFSHHQIFLFIVDLLHMFDSNQPLIFPVAPLLTVILALVGMEAIMSEIFNDTTTAFYVILLVWMADQYDAICCKSSIGKRFWLRFFYLYHFAFYAYHYRFSGQYSGLALLTSAFFILHSMIFFFHHYEMPLIVYQERLRQIINDLQHSTINSSATLNVSVTITESTQNVSSVLNSNGSTVAAETSAIPQGTTSTRDLAQQEIDINIENDPLLRRVGEETANAIVNETMEEIFADPLAF